MLGLILAAAQAVGGIGKAIQANQERQRQKGIIGRAYGIARERLATRQGDIRQGTAEALTARGLTHTGGGRTPHDLGSQRVADTEHEFDLERRDLGSREEMARAGINQSANAAIAGGITEGLVGAAGTYDALHNPSASPISAAYGAGRMVDTPPAGAPSPYDNAWGGIDPIDPLGRGAWKSADTTGGFNKFNQEAT